MDYKNFLSRQYKSGKIHHAYIITGRYCNKEEVVEYIIEMLQSSKEDVLKIDGQQGSISINEIKALKKELVFAPFNSPRKIAIISPADHLTTEAQNAMLKILEEPADRAVILLVVEDEDKILPTIVSRAQKIRLSYNQQRDGFDDDLSESLGNKSLSLAQRFDFAERLSKDEAIIRKLDGLLVRLRNSLIKEPSDKQIVNLIDEVQRSRVMLTTNANSRLVLENLVLKF